MDVLTVLERLRQTEWVDAEGETLEVRFAPGFPVEEIDRFEGELGAPLPLDYRIFAQNCSAMEGASIEFDLRFGTDLFWIEELLPCGVPFAHDGCGNYWVVDCRSEREERSHIFYVCHDPPYCSGRGSGWRSF